MEFSEVINNRYSANKFSDIEVSQEIKKIKGEWNNRYV